MTLTILAPLSNPLRANPVRDIPARPPILAPLRSDPFLQAAADDDAADGKGDGKGADDAESGDEETVFEDDDLGFDGGFAPAEIEEFDEADFDDDFDDDFEEELDEDDLGDDDDNGVTETDNDDDEFDDEE